MWRIHSTRAGRGAIARLLHVTLAGGLLAAIAYPSAAFGVAAVQRSKEPEVTGSSAPTTYVRDAFTRTVSVGWGTANTGQTWKVSSPGESYVANGYGTIVDASNEDNTALVHGPWKNVVLTGLVQVNKVPAYSGEEVTQGFWIRKQTGAEVGFFEELVCRQGQDARLQTQYNGSVGKVLESDIAAPYGACQKNTWYWIKCQVLSVSSSKTRISMETWLYGGKEPGWQATTYDAHNDVQVGGDIEFETTANGTRVSEGTFRHRLNIVTVTSA